MKNDIISKAALVLLLSTIAACIIEPEHLSKLDTGPLFLVQKSTEGERDVMDALYRGSVVEIDGCFRLGGEPVGHTVVWPPGYALVDRTGKYRVVDETGYEIGQIEESFRFGGGEVPTLWAEGPVDEAIRLAALRRCPGRYWLVGEVLDN